MIRYTAFCKIVELGSFTRAAESIGYTQAAVSQMIRSLETEFKLSLIIRMRSGIRLTPEGEALYPMVQSIVAAHRILEEKVRELGSLESGVIRIGTFSSVSQNLLPSLIRAFSAEHPGIRFTLHSGDNASMSDMIRHGVIDFGFIYPSAAHGLPYRSLFRDEFLAVLPQGHPLSNREKLLLSDLASEPMIALDEGNLNTAADAFRAAGITPNLQFLIHDDYTILAMIEEGLGIGILPAAILRHTNYHLNAIPFDPPITREIGIAYLNRHMLPVAAGRFIEFLAEQCTDA